MSHLSRRSISQSARAPATRTSKSERGIIGYRSRPPARSATHLSAHVASIPFGRPRAAITHNLLRAAGSLAGPTQAVARGATLRRTLVNVPARLAQPQRRTVLHLPEHWPWAKSLVTLWDRVVGDGLPPPIAA